MIYGFGKQKGAFHLQSFQRDLPQFWDKCARQPWEGRSHVLSRYDERGPSELYHSISTPTGSYGSMTIPLCRATPKSSIYRWNFPHKPSIWGVPPFMENPHISSHVLSTPQSSGHRFSAFKSSGFVRHTIRNTKPGSSIKGE